VRFSIAVLDRGRYATSRRITAEKGLAASREKRKSPCACPEHLRQGSIQGSILSESERNSERLKPPRNAKSAAIIAIAIIAGVDFG
jgi:hypothetical protein